MRPGTFPPALQPSVTSSGATFRGYRCASMDVAGGLLTLEGNAVKTQPQREEQMSLPLQTSLSTQHSSSSCLCPATARAGRRREKQAALLPRAAQPLSLFIPSPFHSSFPSPRSQDAGRRVGLQQTSPVGWGRRAWSIPGNIAAKLLSKPGAAGAATCFL